MFCLSPPLTKIPKGNWFCPNCTRLSSHSFRSLPGRFAPPSPPPFTRSLRSSTTASSSPSSSSVRSYTRSGQTRKSGADLIGTRRSKRSKYDESSEEEEVEEASDEVCIYCSVELYFPLLSAFSVVGYDKLFLNPIQSHYNDLPVFISL